jgi:hypothetical protein
VIRDDVDAALRLGVATAYHYARRPPTEPELVAGVFSAGLPDLAYRLSTTAPGSRIAGVFCHARPMATKPSDRSWKCEVGDLLVVSRYDDGSTIERSALLLQVKKGAPARFASSGTAAHQVELYQYWPLVEVFGTARDIDNPPHRGAQFSYWDVCAAATAPCSSCRWDERIPGDPLNASLGDEWADVITLSGGRPFVEEAAVATSGDDWSGLIWDLIKRSVNHAWTVARGAQSSRSRTWDAGVFVVSSSTTIPALVAEAELGGAWRELTESADTGPFQDAPPLSPELPNEPELSDEGGIPIIFTETAGPLRQGEPPPEAG